MRGRQRETERTRLTTFELYLERAYTTRALFAVLRSDIETENGPVDNEKDPCGTH